MIVIDTPGWSALNESAAAWSQALDGSVNVIKLRDPESGVVDDFVVLVVVVVVEGAVVEVVGGVVVVDDEVVEA